MILQDGLHQGVLGVGVHGAVLAAVALLEETLKDGAGLLVQKIVSECHCRMRYVMQLHWSIVVL